MPVVYEGEAPETDDEADFSEEIPPVETKVIAEKSLKKKSSKPRHVDERLVERWRNLGRDVTTVCQKRTQPAEKLVEQIVAVASDTFTSMQHVGVKLNVTSSNLARLEDSIADLAEAAKLIPSNLPSKATVINP
ncbi:unnamed protein product [Caenorhabditis auriculariae]|uniref:Biogenesis of lysosome-related organelles complex 1 subunit 3 n=1 Tax=Caenorhabditis auriculariae TaxID=2777116 RepID=A0A8S1HLW9_9PELO|nr:unnamed protein product [Caenorhabditis auriculariae]